MKMSRILLMTAVCMMASGVRAGALNPTNAPGPSMYTLEEIYQSLMIMESNQIILQTNQIAIQIELAAHSQADVPDGMALVPEGDFWMGDYFVTDGGSLEDPYHMNTISAFYMDTHEVTKDKWDEVYDWAITHGYTFSNTGSVKGVGHPVHTVNWYDCVKWANARSQMEGLQPCYYASTGVVYRTNNLAPICEWTVNGYRLPTEAEWEKAARGGAADMRFPFSDTNVMFHSRANYWADNSQPYDGTTNVMYHPEFETGGMPYTSPVGSFAPNGYGIYDMAGNLFEWCWDWHSSGYYSSTPPTVDPKGPPPGVNRANRGGSWFHPSSSSRVAFRTSYGPGSTFDTLGFRLVRRP